MKTYKNLPLNTKIKYIISEDGEIVNQKTGAIKSTRVNKGYLIVRIKMSGKVKEFSVHRLVAIAFIPNPKGKPQVNHIDGNPLNCHVSNLEWTTAKENTAHAYQTGLAPVGTNRWNSMWTDKDVKLMRYKFDNNISTVRQMADEYEVTYQNIYQIVKRITWKHLP